MTDRAELQRLQGEAGTLGVLSLYAEGGRKDPAAMGAWYVAVEQGIRTERARVAAESPAQLADFDAAWSLLREALPPQGRLLGSAGFVGLATPQRVIHAEHLSASVPTFVGWERTPCLASLAWARSTEGPAVVVLVDHRHARIFRYAEGVLEETHDLVADRSLGDLSEVGVRKAASTHSGVRGQTAHDAAHYAIEEATARLLREMVEPVRAAATPGCPVLVGGDGHVAHALLEALPPELRAHSGPILDVYLRMPDSELRERAEEARRVARLERGMARIEEWLEHDRSHRRAALGTEETTRALEEGAVEVLLLSESFLRGQPEAANRLVDLVLSQGGEPEVVEGPAAARLDDETGGVGAVLRFSVAGLTAT